MMWERHYNPSLRHRSRWVGLPSATPLVSVTALGQINTCVRAIWSRDIPANATSTPPDRSLWTGCRPDGSGGGRCVVRDSPPDDELIAGPHQVGGMNAPERTVGHDMPRTRRQVDDGRRLADRKDGQPLTPSRCGDGVEPLYRDPCHLSLPSLFCEHLDCGK